MESNTGKNYYNIEPLNGHNYHAWKFRVLTVLTEKGVEDMISEEYKASDFENAAEWPQIKKLDNKCKSIIVQSVGDNQIDII